MGNQKCRNVTLFFTFSHIPTKNCDLAISFPILVSMGYHRHTLIVGLSLCLLFPTLGAQEALRGVLDLRQTPSDELTILKGQWWFRSLETPQSEMPELLIPVPGSWKSHTGETYTAGEYRLTILFPDNVPMNGALLFSELSQILVILVNGEEVFRSGNWEMNQTHFTRQQVPIRLQPETEIILKLKNVVFRKGGLIHAPQIGTYERVFRYRLSRMFIEALNIGIFFFIAIYHVFQLSRHYIKRSAVYLVLAAAMAMLRGFIAGENIISIFLPNFPWELDYGLEYFTVYGSLSGLILYTYNDHSVVGRSWRLWMKILSTIGIFFALLSLMIPIKLLSPSIYGFQIYMALSLGYILALLIKGVYERGKKALPFAFAALVLATFSAMDSLYYLGLDFPFNLSQLGLMIFLLTHVFTLSHYHGEAFLQAESLALSLEQEVAERTRQLQQSNAQLRKKIAEKNEAEKRLVRLSTTDPLLGIANRLKINEDLYRAHALHKRYSTPYGVILFDVDHFKSVNDRYGHDCGDRVLQDVANIAGKQIREEDVLARWGGEEFLVLLASSLPQKQIHIAERIRSALEVHDFDQVGTVTASFGCATPKEDEDSVDTVVKRADRNLYEAKESGRNRVVGPDSAPLEYPPDLPTLPSAEDDLTL
ncbi:MAG: diguanylate cyclase [Spirochaetales bacterium]|nr:diguanylate cyclase [Spirochaetales bacterium]